MRRLHAIALFLSLGVIPARGETPQRQLKPTERVVTQYLKLVAKGALLTPEGWNEAGLLFTAWSGFPSDGPIRLMTTGGTLGEMWMKEDRADVETKWTNDMGTIDSLLRYEPPVYPHVTMTTYAFTLVLTNKVREPGAMPGTTTEATGPREWKMEGPLKDRFATVESAIAYVTRMRDRATDPRIKNNAEQTIKTLQHLSKNCGNASAC
jgi:hypothetical protein